MSNFQIITKKIPAINGSNQSLNTNIKISFDNINE